MRSFLLDHFILAACAPEEEATVKRASQKMLELTDSVTLSKIAEEMGKEARGIGCYTGSDGKSWVDRFVGTPLFEQAVALQQTMLQHDSEHRQKEQQVTDLRKQLQVDWDDRRAVEDQLDLQRQMLDLQLAQFNNAQIAQPEAVPSATLGQVAASMEPAPKMASAFAGLAKHLPTARGGAALGALAGGAYGALNAAPGESALAAAAKGGLAGGALGGVAGAGAGKLLAGRAAPAAAALDKTQLALPAQAIAHPGVSPRPAAVNTGGAAARELRPGLEKTVPQGAPAHMTQAGAPSPAALTPSTAPSAPAASAPLDRTIQPSPLAQTADPASKRNVYDFVREYQSRQGA